jgi:hypothetical protein
MNNVSFVPQAYDVMSVVEMRSRQRSWYNFAITFGAVEGPFTRDPDMYRVGSMQCGRYQAQVILTNCVVMQGFKLAHRSDVSAYFACPERSSSAMRYWKQWTALFSGV